MACSLADVSGAQLQHMQRCTAAAATCRLQRGASEAHAGRAAHHQVALYHFVVRVIHPVHNRVLSSLFGG